MIIDRTFTSGGVVDLLAHLFIDHRWVIFRVFNFRSWPRPRNYFNSVIFLLYGIHPLQASTHILNTSCTHTQVKTSHMDLLWDQLISVYRPRLTFDRNLTFKKISTPPSHPHSNQPKLSPVSESSTYPLQNEVRFCLLTSGSVSYVHKPTPYQYPLNGAKLHKTDRRDLHTYCPKQAHGRS